MFHIVKRCNTLPSHSCTVHNVVLYTVLYCTQYCNVDMVSTIHSVVLYIQCCTVASGVMYTVLYCTQ